VNVSLRLLVPLIAASLALLSIVPRTALAAPATICTDSGPHAWIFPEALFAADAYTNPLGISGDDVARLFAESGVTVSNTIHDVVLQDDRRVFWVDDAVTWKMFGLTPSGESYWHNLLDQSGGGTPAQYTLTFDRPVRMIRFIRAALLAGSSGITHPEWTAIARDASGATVASASEPLIMSYSAVPPRGFDLTGDTSITSVTFYGNDQNFAGFSNVAIQLIGWCR
jgi:hypothetical protein